MAQVFFSDTHISIKLYINFCLFLAKSNKWTWKFSTNELWCANDTLTRDTSIFLGQCNNNNKKKLCGQTIKKSCMFILHLVHGVHLSLSQASVIPSGKKNIHRKKCILPVSQDNLLLMIFHFVLALQNSMCLHTICGTYAINFRGWAMTQHTD